MGGLDPLGRIVAEQDLRSAQDRSKKVKDQLAVEQAESLKVYEAFYTHLALLAGGTVALSVTYLGYLQHSEFEIAHIGLLVGSWTCLVVTIPLSLFVSYVHAHYTYYARMAEYQRAIAEQRRAEAGLIGRVQIVDLAEEQMPAERGRLNEAARKCEESARKLSKFERFYFNAWKVDGWAARGLLSIGLIVLLLFASWNAVHRQQKPDPAGFVRLRNDYIIRPASTL